MASVADLDADARRAIPKDGRAKEAAGQGGWGPPAAWTRPARRRLRAAVQSPAPGLLRGIGWFLIAVAAYFLTYQLFFIATPLEKISRVQGGEERDFRYDGVVYFYGRSLAPGETLEMRYSLPWIARLGRPDLEIFMERATDGEEPASTFPPGRLEISGDGADTILQLQPERLQRYRIDWNPSVRSRADLSFTYDATPGGNDRLIVATNVVGFNVWPFVLLFGGLGAGLLVQSYRRLAAEKASAIRADIICIGLIVAAGFYFHSGGFISNTFFQGHGRIGSYGVQLLRISETGYLAEKTYRDVGTGIIPALTALVEVGPYALLRPFRDYMPTSRFIMFAITMWGIGYLSLTLMRRFSRPLGLVFGLLSVTYFPAMVELYRPDSDGYFVMLFPFLMAFVINMMYDQRRANMYFLASASLLAVFATIKITPIFLAVVLPVALLFFEGIREPVKAGLLLAGRVAVLLLAFMIGSWTAASFHNPDRHVGIEDVEFQDTVMWHIIWGAYGLYDRHSAHWFTKSGPQRQDRVSEATGLPPEGYLRQAQIATEEVYKPAVLNALKERPGFFYSTAFLRFYNDGFRFYRYTRGGTNDWTHWFNDGSRGRAVISGEEVSLLRSEREAIRYGEAWKISPLILLAKITQQDMTRLSDLALFIAALLGIFMFRNNGVRAFLILVVLAQLGFASGIHVMNRYVMFCSFALLLGLAAFLVRSGSIFYAYRRPPAEKADIKGW